ncbi:hypothetical protein B1C78_11935 [Thioalkalivibrio denitrificans]|uniref:Flagellar brake protein n=1 Tax=Thioalkalivibrio denitrificans TaxID=108003 RepID=A0A1V3NEI1_9GAMM|nr:flagellar brake protein [Thioalkalivibrio denitrificans]OOG23262.1 hypothetical protein B1C78_11935 [Thioalkalivibrio denitrificans]
MSSYDEHVEKQFETGKRVSIEMGTEVLMQIEGVAGRLPSTFIGMEAGRYAIFKIPRASVSLTAKLIKGNMVVVRYRYHGSVFGFQTPILGTVVDPFGLLFVACPKIIEEYNLRKARRIDCYLPCTVKIGEEKAQGTVVDISVQGCRCFFSAPDAATVSDDDGGTPAEITLSLEEGEAPVTLPGRIVSAHPYHGALSAGIEFNELDDAMKKRVKNYVATVAD